MASKQKQIDELKKEIDELKKRHDCLRDTFKTHCQYHPCTPEIPFKRTVLMEGDDAQLIVTDGPIPGVPISHMSLGNAFFYWAKKHD